MFSNVEAVICPCREIVSAQQKIWKKHLLLSKSMNSQTTHIIVGRRSVTTTEIARQLNCTTTDITKLNCVHFDWIVDSIKQRQTLPHAGYLIDDQQCMKRQRVEPYVSKPPDVVHIGDIPVYAYGLGSLPWGVSYPDPSLRPDASTIRDMVRLAREKIHPYSLYIDTADTYCADGANIGYVERIICTEVLSDVCETAEGEGHGSGADADAPESVLRPCSIPLVNVDTNFHQHECSSAPIRPGGCTRIGRVVVGTKGGMTRLGSESSGWRMAGYRTQQHWEACIRSSVSRLGYTASCPLPLWMVHHCQNEDAAWDVVLRACAQVIREGLVKNIGLCNVTVSRFEYCVSKAAALGFRVACVQNQFSLWESTAKNTVPLHPGRSSEAGTLDMCNEFGIPFIAYGALGGTSSRSGRVTLQDDFPVLQELAALKGVSPHVLVLAYMRHRWPCILHIAGARSISHVDDYVSSVNTVRFTESELKSLDLF